MDIPAELVTAQLSGPSSSLDSAEPPKDKSVRPLTEWIEGVAQRLAEAESLVANWLAQQVTALDGIVKAQQDNLHSIESALHLQSKLIWVRMRTMMDRRQIESAVRYQIAQLFAVEGITVAFPQRDVHLNTTSPLIVQMAASNHESPQSQEAR